MRTRAAGPEFAPVLALAIVACGGAAPEAEGPKRDLPPFTGRPTELFDDKIEPGALGAQLGVIDPGGASRGTVRTDSLLNERTRQADAVVRARVTTVTANRETVGARWQIGLRTMERLAGAGPLGQEFTLQVGATDPSAGVLRAFESRLIGSTFVALVRKFAQTSPGGETQLHFHVASDSKAELEAVHAAVLLGSVR
jgi:hypothetical protein